MLARLYYILAPSWQSKKATRLSSGLIQYSLKSRMPVGTAIESTTWPFGGGGTCLPTPNWDKHRRLTIYVIDKTVNHFPFVVIFNNNDFPVLNRQTFLCPFRCQRVLLLRAVWRGVRRERGHLDEERPLWAYAARSVYQRRLPPYCWLLQRHPQLHGLKVSNEICSLKYYSIYSFK